GRAPAFDVGDRVRVRAGVRAPDNPDMPIGGWCGVVTEVEESARPPGYLVAWDRRTLDQMHPVFVKRCQRDDLEVETMWLDEGELEPDRGELLPIERPGELAPRPLSPADQGDRVREVFGLTSDDPLPEVTDATLARYHQFLSERLQFPFAATTPEEDDTFQVRDVRTTVVGLVPLSDCDTEDGL